ncbi:hypothetical protein ACJX0J_015794, partial [Zea mays]
YTIFSSCFFLFFCHVLGNFEKELLLSSTVFRLLDKYTNMIYRLVSMLDLVKYIYNIEKY